MQGADWIALFRRFPVNLHDGLILSLTTGAEVVVQKFVKLEADYLILRGRMAGTQDNGRVTILPYSNIVTINITRRLLEAEIEGVFGKDSGGFAASVPLTAAAAAETSDGDTPLDTAEAVAEANAPERNRRSRPCRRRRRCWRSCVRGSTRQTAWADSLFTLRPPAVERGVRPFPRRAALNVNNTRPTRA